MSNIIFPYCSGNIKDSRVIGFTNLTYFIKQHKNPKQETIDLIDDISKASLAGDKELKANLKKKLYSFTPAVVISLGAKRSYENVFKFTGLVQIDIDGIDPDEVEALKEYLFTNYEQFYCVYKSPSGKGVKGLMRIEIPESIEEYKQYFQAIENELDWIYGWDSSPKNAVLPLFLSYDRNILFRNDARKWIVKAKRSNVAAYYNLSTTPGNYKPKAGDANVYKSAAYYEKITLDIFKKRIDDIVETPGHPKVRSASLVLGSRIAAGYVSLNDALTYAEQVVRSNSYLSKGIENYIKTLKWGVNRGTHSARYYE